jgi:hypothetical protein
LRRKPPSSQGGKLNKNTPLLGSGNPNALDFALNLNNVTFSQKSGFSQFL